MAILDGTVAGSAMPRIVDRLGGTGTRYVRRAASPSLKDLDAFR